MGQLADGSIEAFIGRWSRATGSEKANYQIFLTELCSLLELPKPNPASENTRDNDYVFERRITFRHGDGSESAGFIDLYRRGAFVCEAKKLRQIAGKGFDDALLRARSQAEQYARSLPASEGRPPFLVVVDVGNVIELFAEFTRSGATYTPFPDPRSHRVTLDDLRNEEVRARLRSVWTDPLALDPTRRSAKVTREIAGKLAEIARSLEEDGHHPELVAGFLGRCLFTYFAEDVGLLPKRSFTNLLEQLADSPQQFPTLVGDLWSAMNEGGFAISIRSDVPRFNGKHFKQRDVLPLTREQIDLLLEAARANWEHVEPAIFGTLLERALDPKERHRLGAHYTPRAYVERLVLPTIIEPLREDWKNAQTAALTLAAEGKIKEAQAVVRQFHRGLCNVRVLDPACGSGNFLYVTLEHLKRLEGEVLNQLEDLGDRQALLDLAGVTVDPHQLLGIEINPRAAAIAEMVLWIGYLQWHFRTRGNVPVPQPVLKDFKNIECRDAVLAYDDTELVRDESGRPVTRWDGVTFKQHPVTGEEVPDESARAAIEIYIKPQKAQWPQADFIVGNPPFIGTWRLRQALGDGYAEALRETWSEVPESADYVMYWWHHAAELARAGQIRQFGLITTNSLRQTFNRRIVETQLTAKPPLSLTFAIPDHPWVDASDGAAVRIAMSVAAAGDRVGRLLTVREEHEADGEGVDVELGETSGKIFADLRTGANVAGAVRLEANDLISSPGVKLHGAGFQITHDEAVLLGLTSAAGLGRHIRRYLNGRDLTQVSRDLKVIDLFGLEEGEVRQRFPAVYQWVIDRVKPERDQNNRATYRDNWWIFGEPRKELRIALDGVDRYIATVETSKHRFFCFVGKETLPDNMLIAIAIEGADLLSILSADLHIRWALATGGTLEDRPRYNKTRCFETFPFPVLTTDSQQYLDSLGEQLDAHRKRQQAEHADLTMTGMYNVLEKLRSGDSLNEKEKGIHEQGLVSVLKQIHDSIDLTVIDAYGWVDLKTLQQVVNGNLRAGEQATPETREECEQKLEAAVLERLVALNAERAAEERRGLVRWVRPEFQNAKGKQQSAQVEMEADEAEHAAVAKISKITWPKDLAEQARVVHASLGTAGSAVTPREIAAYFKGARVDRVEQLLDTLVSLGRARFADKKYAAVQ